MNKPFHGRPARQCGRSAVSGPVGKLIYIGQKAIAAIHFLIAVSFGRHDIVQVRDEFFVAPLALAVSRLTGKSFVFWLSYPFPESRIQDAREGRAKNRAYSFIYGWLSTALLYRCVLPYADHVFVQSAQMKQDVLRPGIDATRISVVPMGLPDDDLPAEAAPALEPLVLYLGTLASVRRLGMVIDAFVHVRQQMPQARLAIVGEGDMPSERAALEAQVAALGLSEAVQFTGLVPRSTALRWVDRAAVCLSPFYPTFVLRSTSPTKLVEYMAAGKAVVANDHPEQAQVLQASGAGLCTPWDAKAYADAIVRLLRDAELRRACGTRGRQWVIEHRLYSTIASDVMGHYRRLATAVSGDAP